MGIEVRYADLERRSLRETALPDVPVALMVEVSSACNFKCRYCPTTLDKNARAPGGVMPFEIFKALVDGVKASGKRIDVLGLTRMGEPLTNKRLPEMIRYAKASGGFGTVSMISNGTLLTPALSLELLDAGLDLLQISIQGTSPEKYKELCGIDIEFNSFVGNIAYFYANRQRCKLSLKVFREGLDGDEDGFKKIFSNICDEYSFEYIIPLKPEHASETYIMRDGIGRYGDRVVPVDACALPFFLFTVMRNGDVSPCCYSINESLIVGNVMDSSVIDIWHSEKMRALREMQLSKGRHNHKVCADCLVPEYGMFYCD
jgi:radical SAM protein with 4Fe4S-binding SPASM domain